MWGFYLVGVCGSSGQVLTSKGSGAAVAWEDASGGGGDTDITSCLFI